jgi:type II secretory pathway pseudopilin PulG
VTTIMTSQRFGTSGFSLVEVAFSIAIIGLAVITSMALFAAGTKAQSRANLRMVAAITAQYLTDQTLLQSKCITPGTNDPTLGVGKIMQNAGILTPVNLVPAPADRIATGWSWKWANTDDIFLKEWDSLTPEKQLSTVSGEVYALTSASTQATAGPTSQLLFRFSRVGITSPGWSKIQVWSGDWLALPDGAQLRADLVGTYLYFDYKQ